MHWNKDEIYHNYDYLQRLYNKEKKPLIKTQIWNDLCTMSVIKSQYESGGLVINSSCEVDATGTYTDGTGTYTITKFGWGPLPRAPYVIDSNGNSHDLSSQYQAVGSVTDYIGTLI